MGTKKNTVNDDSKTTETASTKKSAKKGSATTLPQDVNLGNIDDVIKDAPSLEMGNKQADEQKSKADKLSAPVVPPKPNPLDSTSDAIMHTINTHWRAHSKKEVHELMVRGNYPFHWAITENPGQPQNQIFIVLDDGTNKGRVPRNPDAFITVNG